MHGQSITHNATRRAFSAAFPCERYKINDQSRSICFFFFSFFFLFLFFSSLFLLSSLSSLGPPVPLLGAPGPPKGPNLLTQLWLLYPDCAPVVAISEPGGRIRDRYNCANRLRGFDARISWRQIRDVAACGVLLCSLHVGHYAFRPTRSDICCVTAFFVQLV